MHEHVIFLVPHPRQTLAPQPPTEECILVICFLNIYYVPHPVLGTGDMQTT